MTDPIQYRGYYATFEVDTDSKLIVGKVLNVRAAILFEGETFVDAEADFHAAVDEYLTDCEARGVSPEESFSGTLQVRLDSKADHHALATLAAKNGSSINAEVKAAVKERLIRHADDSQPATTRTRHLRVVGGQYSSRTETANVVVSS